MRVRLLILSICLVIAPAAGALEVDPYLAWLADIPDSLEALNAYTTATISGHLQEMSEGREIPAECAAVAYSALKRFHRSVLQSRRGPSPSSRRVRRW